MFGLDDLDEPLRNAFNTIFEQLSGLEQGLKEIGGSILPELSQSIATIKNDISSFEGQLNDLPTTLKNEIVAERDSLKLGIQGTYNSAGSTLQNSFSYISSHIDEFEKWDQVAKFRSQLTHFVTNIWAVPNNASKIFPDFFHFDSSDDYIIGLIQEIPDFALHIISKGLKPFEQSNGDPIWLVQSQRILDLSAYIKSEQEITQLIVDKAPEVDEIKARLEDLKLLIDIFNPTLEFFKSCCPEDLSINIDLLGEGGGTEVAGHPIKIPFDLISWITAITEVACDRVLEIIADASEQN